jgi:hypothetical protein
VGHEGDPDFRQRFERKARAISGNIMLTKSEAKLLDFEHGTEVSPEVKHVSGISRQKGEHLLCGLDLLAEGEEFEPEVRF